MFEIIGYVIGSAFGAALILTPTIIAWVRDHHCRKTVATLNILAPGFTPLILLLPFMILIDGFDKTSNAFIVWYIVLGFAGFIAVIVWAAVGRKATVLMSAKRKIITIAAAIAVLAGIFDIQNLVIEPLNRSVTQHAATPPTANTPVPVPKKTADLDSGPYAATPWKQVDDWIIRFDQSAANSSGEMNGCFMFRTFGDAMLRIAFYAPANDYFIAFTNQTLLSILEKGRSYDIRLRFGNQSPWDVQAMALEFPGGDNFKVLGFRTAADPKFFTELLGQPTLDISQGNAPILHFNLSGSRAAFQEMLSCQESHSKKPDHL